MLDDYLFHKVGISLSNNDKLRLKNIRNCDVSENYNKYNTFIKFLNSDKFVENLYQYVYGCGTTESIIELYIDIYDFDHKRLCKHKKKYQKLPLVGYGYPVSSIKFEKLFNVGNDIYSHIIIRDYDHKLNNWDIYINTDNIMNKVVHLKLERHILKDEIEIYGIKE